MIRRLLAVFSALLIALGLVSCASPTSSAPNSPTSAASSAASSTQYPFTIQTFDFSNNPVEVTFEKAPEKVLVDGVNNLEIMLRLGLEDRIALNASPDSDLAEVFPDLVSAYDKVNTVDNFPSKEEVIALQPDLILGWYGAFQEKMLGDVDFWHERNINTYMSLNSYAQGPTVPTEIKYEFEDILNIGMIFDKQAEANALVAEMQQAVEDAKTNLASSDPKTIAILENYNGKFMVYGANTLAGSIAEAAGAQIVIGGKDQESKFGATSVNAEQLIESNPEYIFMVYYGEPGSDLTAIESITKDPALASLTAVQNDHVRAIQLSYIYTSGLRTLYGIQTFAEGLNS